MFQLCTAAWARWRPSWTRLLLWVIISLRCFSCDPSVKLTLVLIGSGQTDALASLETRLKEAETRLDDVPAEVTGETHLDPSAGRDVLSLGLFDMNLVSGLSSRLGAAERHLEELQALSAGEEQDATVCLTPGEYFHLNWTKSSPAAFS